MEDASLESRALNTLILGLKWTALFVTCSGILDQIFYKPEAAAARTAAAAGGGAEARPAIPCSANNQCWAKRPAGLDSK